MSGTGEYPVDAPGWAAIDQALAGVYAHQTPHQFASHTAYDLDSNRPLPAVGVYEARDPNHWHYVSYGLTELFEKSSAIPDVSGFGFELTFRLPRGSGQETPPVWPVQLLQGIGGYVLTGHGRLDSGHCIDLGGRLAPNTDTRLTGVLCLPDPDLGQIETPHGRVLFLQLLGLTSDEVEQIHEWSLERKVGFATEAVDRGITDLQRKRFEDDPATQRTWRRFTMNIGV